MTIAIGDPMGVADAMVLARNAAVHKLNAWKSDPDRRGDWMQTCHGRQFYPLDPRPEEVHIDDIASALSKLCRYGGHTKRFYSVAEHCVLVASKAPKALQLSALMHDASEAYLSDIIRPIKPYLDGYVAFEDTLMHAIANRFGFAWPMLREIKALDNAILADELKQVMSLPAGDWGLPEPPLGVEIKCWNPSFAEKQFLAAFRAYGGK